MWQHDMNPASQTLIEATEDTSDQTEEELLPSLLLSGRNQMPACRVTAQAG